MLTMKRSILSVLLLSAFVSGADPVAVPDTINKGGKIWIDFKSKEMIHLAPGTTISDAADLAGVLLESYLKPNVESGHVSFRDVCLLNFCFHAYDLQAQKCRLAFEQGMGRSEKVRNSEVFFYDCETTKKDAKRTVEDIRKKLSALSLNLDGESASFCNLYNAKNDENAFLFCNEEKIVDVMRASRNKDNIEVLVLDPKAYGNIPELRWTCGCVWGAGIGIVVGAAGIAGIVSGAWAMAGTAAFVPGPGWFVAGGAVLLAGGVATYAYFNNKAKKEMLNAVVLENERIENYLKRVGDRKSYLKEVVESPYGIYQRSYLGLVKVTMLIDSWKRDGWKGLGRLSAKGRRNLDDAADEARDWARDDLTKLEDGCVNYPLLVNLMEASSVCLYLNYLDVKNISRTTKAKDEIRQTYLENAGTVADVCSRLSKYSTGRVALSHITAYNGFFEQCYATNRVGLIKPQKKKDVEEYLKNNRAKFADEDVDLVRKGCIDVPFGREYAVLLKDNELLRSNAFLNEIVGSKVGEERLDEWKREVDGRIADHWLYPSWCEEVSSAILPDGTEEIAQVISSFSPEKPNADRVRLIFDVVIAADADLAGLATLKDVFGSADTVDEVKKAIVDDYNRRKDDLDGEIKEKYGSVEKMVSLWVDDLVLKDTNGPMAGSTLKVADVAVRMKAEIAPMWKRIEPIRRKWWRILF